MDDKTIIQQMDFETRKLFLQIAMKLVCSDGNLDGLERKVVSGLARKYGLSPEDMDEVKIIPSKDEIFFRLRDVVYDRPTALFLIKEMISVADVDEDFADEEEEFVFEVAHVLKIEISKVRAIYKLVQDYKDWLYQRDVVMEYIEAPERYDFSEEENINE